MQGGIPNPAGHERTTGDVLPYLLRLRHVGECRLQRSGTSVQFAIRRGRIVFVVDEFDRVFDCEIGIFERGVVRLEGRCGTEKNDVGGEDVREFEFDGWTLGFGSGHSPRIVRWPDITI